MFRSVVKSGHGRLLASLAIASAALVASPVEAQVKSWNTDFGNWGIPGNWSPVGLPGPANLVLIGNTAAAENAFVTMNVDAVIATLSITDGMVLDTENSQLIVTGAATISGENFERPVIYPSRLRVGDGPALHDAIIGAITVSDDAWVEMDGGILVVNGVFTLEESTLLTGGGTVIVDGDQPVALLIDGSLGADVDGLTLIQNGTGRIDLDGNVVGGLLNLTGAMIDGSGFDTLEIQGVGLADAMDDDIWLSGGNQLTMILDEGWALGIFATLRFFDSSITETPAFVNGDHFTIDGTILSESTGSHLFVSGPVTLNASASIDIGPDDEVEFNGTATVNGGEYLLDDGAVIHFDGTTDVFGGTFTTFSASLSDGGIEFNGQTDYDGDVTVNGAARQNGDVSIDGPTVIDADTFDMDGLDGVTEWSIGNNLVINTNSIDSAPNQPFDGTFNIAGTFLGKLTVNLDNPNAHWSADGTLDLGGVAAIMITRIEGSPMWVSGDLTITNRVQITADTQLLNGCDVHFNSDSARLRFSGETIVNEGVSFTGGGRLENAAGGDLTLAHTLNLTGTDLLNAGTLRLGTSPGLAIVGDLTFEPTSTWVVEVGGPAFGTQFDQLNTSSPAQLAGTLDIDLVDLGNGVFQPNLGASFTILKAAPNALSGTFSNQPVSFAPNNVYHWTVTYSQGPGASNVTISVADITPCDGDLNGDGEIDAADLAILLGSWGPCPDCVADLDSTDVVDAADLAILLGAWGPCPIF